MSNTTVETSQQPTQQQSLGENNKQNFSIEKDENAEVTTTVRMIEGTIFQIRWIKGKGYAYGINGDRLSEWHETEEKAIKELKKGGLNWRLITAVVSILVRQELELQEIEERSKRTPESMQGMIEGLKRIKKL